MTRLRFDRTAVVVLVLLAHGLVAIGLQARLRGTRTCLAEPPRRALAWRLLADEPAVRTDTAPTARPSLSTSATAARRERSSAPHSIGAPANAATPAATSTEPVTPAASPSPSASTPTEVAPPLDLVATRRAIRESALGTGTGAQQAIEAGASLRARTAPQRLSDEVNQAARGDCAKGEFAGSGMGLLSLPFLAAAALKGECSK